MRKLIYWVHTSIDGHIAGPNGEFDWPALGPELADYSYALEDRCDTFVYGRGVWEMMAAYWPIAETLDDDEHTKKFAPIWRVKPKVIFSRTLDKAEWNSRILGGDLAEEVAKLKAEPGTDLLLTGGTELASALAVLGLIDEFHIAIHPVALGGGLPVLKVTDRVNLRLAGSKITDERIMVLHYEPMS